MIITEVFYGLKCNRCGELFEDGEHSFWNDESSAIENATESDWGELNSKHYCPSCHEGDEDRDVIKVYEDFPTHLKTLRKFIDRVAVGSNDVIENEDSFIVKGRLHRKPQFENFEEEFIKSLLFEYFISLEYINGKYGSVTYEIKFSKKRA